MKKAVLLVGFGGPKNRDEVRPFLDSVLQGIPIPKERYDEVLAHYEEIGNISPYNEITQRQKNALEKELARRGDARPVYAGFRHSTPSFQEIFSFFLKDGIEDVSAFILSPLRCYSSFEKYKDRVEEGRIAAGARNVTVNYAGPFHDKPLFIEAQCEKIKQELQKHSARVSETYFIFSAHSIPVKMSEESVYSAQFMRSSFKMAEKMGADKWSCAYQSRSGNPRDPWLEPDVKTVIERVDKKQFKNVLVTPSGFLSDNVEVLFDLDVEARKKAESLGLNFLRAETVMEHPVFIRLMADLLHG